MVVGLVRLVVAASVTAVALSIAADARADAEGGNRFSISYLGYGGDAILSRVAIETDDDLTPDVLRGRTIKLDGHARTLGGGVRGVLELDELRLVGAESFYGIDGTRMLHDALPPGVSIDADDAWGMHGEL